MKFFTEITLVVLMAGLLLLIIFSQRGELQSADTSPGVNCSVAVEEKTVRGNSLTGIIEPGDVISVAFGFYSCNAIKNGDIVAFRHAANEDPVIKVVRGVPGDAFGIQQTENGWHILINGEILKTTAGDPYLLTNKTHRVLLGFEESYNGIIPDDAFLLFGNLKGGALDSTRFGLIHESDIVGKVFSNNGN